MWKTEATLLKLRFAQVFSSFPRTHPRHSRSGGDDEQSSMRGDDQFRGKFHFENRHLTIPAQATVHLDPYPTLSPTSPYSLLSELRSLLGELRSHTPAPAQLSLDAISFA